MMPTKTSGLRGGQLATAAPQTSSASDERLFDRSCEVVSQDLVGGE